MKDEKIELIWRILAGEASELEKEDLEQWISASDENRSYYEQVRAIWITSGAGYNNTRFDKESAIENIRSSVALRKRKAHHRLRLYYSAAASVVVLIGLSIFFSTQTATRLLVYSTTNQVKEIVLPDSSHVWLNEYSTLNAPVSFSKKQRKVTLEGEAFFEVTRDEKRPFKIETGKTVTEVLGTSFNIAIDTLTGNVSVTVNTGKVAFYPITDPGVRSVLSPNDMGSYDCTTGNIRVSYNNNPNFMAWKTGILTFSDTPLGDVCRDLGRYYKITIKVSDSISEESITGSFNNERFDDILKTIELTLNVKASSEGNVITIQRQND
jgi:ferric-dicitrate binding protein FerR (iron transport regulator)